MSNSPPLMRLAGNTAVAANATCVVTKNLKRQLLVFSKGELEIPVSLGRGRC